jgi:hypothetical protein
LHINRYGNIFVKEVSHYKNGHYKSKVPFLW